MNPVVKAIYTLNGAVHLVVPPPKRVGSLDQTLAPWAHAAMRQPQGPKAKPARSLSSTSSRATRNEHCFGRNIGRRDFEVHRRACYGGLQRRIEWPRRPGVLHRPQGKSPIHTRPRMRQGLRGKSPRS